MSFKCSITGKKPLYGNNVSHSNRKTRRRFLPNLHKRRIWCDETSRWVRVLVSNKGLKLIDKIGVKAALEKAEKFTKGDK